MHTLSKSKILAYCHCPRRLWLEIHEPQACCASTDTEARFRAGQRVGEIARRIYDPLGQGVVLDVNAAGVSAAVAQTQQWLTERRPLFEAGFQTPDGTARAFVDVLLPVRDAQGRAAWRMVEVKSSTEVKDYHRQDALFQAWVLRASGLPLVGVALAHIDKNWVYAGNGDYAGLLVEQDVTAEAFAGAAQARAWVEDAQRTIAASQPPRVFTDSHCRTPYACGFLDYCRARETLVSDHHPLDCLPDVRKNTALKQHITTYREQNGVVGLRAVPENLLNDLQRRVRCATITGQPYFDAAGAAQDLQPHGLPAYFLDFESANLAVPLWPGARPYQQTVFQFSCHCQAADGSLSHREFLDLSGWDPASAFADALLAACGAAGPIFVYNQAFEKERIRELAKRFPERKSQLEALNARVVDLLPVARAHYYHPAQRGSWSIKAVLPTVAPELDYEHLTGVRDGNLAAAAYEEAVAPTTAAARRAELDCQLRAYCALDTLALVRLWRFLSGQCQAA